MSEPPQPPRSPARPLPFGGPQRGPALLWTERGANTGAAGPGGPGASARWSGALFLLFWRLLGLLAWPLLALHPRARRHLWGLPAPEPGWIWLHGASAGEHVAARALADALPPEVWRTSSSWRTPVAGAFPAPLDLPFVAAPWIDRARPRLIVLIEAELWPGWLAAARARQIPVVVVNARPGRGTSRLRRSGRLWAWLSQGLTFISQEETGDLKLSTQLRDATFQLGRDSFIAASTRPGDEARLIAAWALLPGPRPLLLLAPRHLDRVAEVAGLLARAGLRFARRSQAEAVPAELDVFLLDTLGELGGLFPQARAAFVGGTFDPAIGGHSPAEAFSAGLPVVHGPATSASPVAWTQGVAFRVDDGPGLDARLANAIRTALAIGPRVAPVNEAAARCAALLPPGATPPETLARPLLKPLAPLWSALVARAPSFSGTPVPVPAPVLSVGALVAGGAGRTPTVGWLAEQLSGTWVVARGYRRAPGGELRVGLPGGEGDARSLGDELEMLRRRGVPVVSAPDRVAGAAEAARLGARLVLIDDGFQHRRLARDVDLVCIDARWPDGRGPIPAGTRREPWSALERAHWIWWSHAGPELDPAALARALGAPRLAELPSVRARLVPAGWLHRGAVLPLAAKGGEVDVLVGVARPEGFLAALLRLGLQIRSLTVLPDHARLPEVPPGAVMTEKDAARLPPDADVYALKMELRVAGAPALLSDLRARLAPRPG